MKLFAPDYYPDFVCTAGACTHNCCIGWEIDIDPKTYAYYQSVSGPMQPRFAMGIVTEGEVPHFALTENDRCPFLNGDNLCDIILTLGEDKLCQICRDHPRFRNFFGDRIEVGLGLCCPAAGRLILTHSRKTEMIMLDDDGKTDQTLPEEEYFFLFRTQLFAILQDRDQSLDQRIQQICAEYDVVLPDKTYTQWAAVYGELIHMDSSWTTKIADLAGAEENDFAVLDGTVWDIAFEQLIAYFLYRHLPDGLEDGRIWERLAFSVHAYQIIRALCAAYAARHGMVTIDDLVEIARLYSAEIEYAKENMDTLLTVLQGDE